jgi:phosphatidylglycerophosphate synthase
MIKNALIFADAAADDSADLPRSLLEVGGISLLERQLRQLKIAGVGEVRIYSRNYPEMLHDRVSDFSMVPEVVSVQDAAAPVQSQWDEAENLLVLEEGVLVDDRVIRAVAGAERSPALALFPPRTVAYGQACGQNVTLGDGAAQLFASVALVPGKFLTKALAAVAKGEKPLPVMLEAAAASKAVAIVDLGAMDLYISDRRRQVGLLWRPVTAAAECRRATRVILGMAQKGTLDWPARWIHPTFENLLVTLLLRSPVTPNVVSLLTGALGFYATYLFATGQMGWALLGALAVGVLDGVDGKLARVKMLATKLGQLEHILDKLVEYSWYIAIAAFLAGEGDNAPWVLALLMVTFAWAEVVQGEFYRRITGRQLDDAGEIERGFRLVTARRNTIMWGLVPFALTESWLIGLWVMGIYTMFTFFVAQWRFIVRLRDYASSVSPDIRNNFKTSEYF